MLYGLSYSEIYRRLNVHVFFDKKSNKLVVSGKTYEIKEDLKQMGFKWNKKRKRWELSIDGKDVDEIRGILWDLEETLGLDIELAEKELNEIM